MARWNRMGPARAMLAIRGSSIPVPLRYTLFPMALRADLQVLMNTLPIENGASLDLYEGVPVFRAPRPLVTRAHELLEEKQTRKLSPHEEQELDRFEGLDDFLSLVNRLVRNALLLPDPPLPHVSPA